MKTNLTLVTSNHSAEPLTADMFIVPNMAVCVPAEKKWSISKKFETVTGTPVNVDEIMVNVWLTSTECENWGDHSETSPAVIGYIPARMLKNIKEGDTLTFKLPDGRVLVLTANQNAYRYRSHGTFEKVYSKVTDSHNWVLCDEYADANGNAMGVEHPRVAAAYAALKGV